jgi:hypothetical protein
MKEKMQYAKPVIVAQNNKNGSFAAGCPSSGSCASSGACSGNGSACKKCERSA